MMHPSLIHMSQFAPVLTLLSDIGAPAEKLLDAAMVPRSVLEDASEFVHARQAWSFVDKASTSQGIPDFGWQVMEAAAIESCGGWARHVVRGPTLRDAIRALSFWYPKEVPIVRTGLSDGGDHAWLWRVRLGDLHREAGAEQIEQFSLGRLVKVVRLAGGQSWVPTHVKLESPRRDSRLTPDALPGAQIQYAQPCIAIAVPWEMLDQRLPIMEPRGATPGRADEPADPGREFTRQLQRLLAPLVGQAPVSLRFAADLVGASERTLRRRLTEEGSGWRELIDDLHVHACLPLVTDPDVPLTEVALTLGYSDQSHFTRAFVRWTGDTPSALRLRHATNPPPRR
jgi:AraC-like DNA-binding protein